MRFHEILSTTLLVTALALGCGGREEEVGTAGPGAAGEASSRRSTAGSNRVSPFRIRKSPCMCSRASQHVARLSETA